MRITFVTSTLRGGGAERVIATLANEFARECFSDKIKKRSVVIPNPIRDDLPEPYTGIRENKIAAVGRLEPQKNHKLLLQLFVSTDCPIGGSRLYIRDKENGRLVPTGDREALEGFSGTIHL